MKTLLIPLFMLLATPLCAVASSTAAVDAATIERIVSPSAQLSAQEKAAVALARKWQDNAAGAAQPMAGQNGSVRFVYGAGQPTIVCAVMQVCDVALQPGEQVNSIHLGDSVRWLVEPAVTGGVGGQVSQHLIIKPLDAGLTTSLIVATSRRTYHLRLRSSKTDYLPQVSFIYADEAAAKWAALQRVQAQERVIKTLPETGEYLDDLDFDYAISGRAPWKPVRVYNDGSKTIIEMPKAMSNTEAPSLLVVRENPGVLTKDETVLVNYRVQGRRYIVDSVFTKAILVAGVGRTQAKITIQRGG